ncbi:cyclopropane-fatty-acyl-phospholipid synthase [Saccharothrix saharensis]|uniref:Cyclopropane-fatty-acyl-phospholipid synthase n=1 Tax=Saccharothrix saharensis TaxID=571190 RepID=A0A543JAR5_9PSEU|nr:class I SAM-dependent methyltransferase [Saccharothrix saharensis]TQM79925.1 cyclopropane-fatty-acyl-phospholipid synthase [Saccharothrix saharensis]
MNDIAVINPIARRHRDYYAGRAAVPFAVRTASGRVYEVGSGEPRFTFAATDRRGEEALASLDQFQIGVAYLEGWLDVEGDFTAALAMRGFFRDFHPVTWIGRYLPTLLGAGTAHDRRAISSHYDIESDFFLTFLDERHRCYTQGAFEHDDESLEDAMTRKMDIALESLDLPEDAHVLEVGGGWGAFLEHAGRRGIRVTALTLAVESERYLNDLVERHDLPVTVVRRHFLEYRTGRKFDAIVNMGVTEHLPDYRRTLRQYADLLRPGGRVYLDAFGMRSKYRMSTFMTRFVYPGRSSPLLLPKYLAHVARSPLQLTGLHDERHNYHLTCRAWARRLDAAREEVVERWGQALYRRFRLFLWASALGFDSGNLQAYRWGLRLPPGR